MLQVEVDGMELGDFPYALNEVAIMKRDFEHGDGSPTG